MLSSRRICLLNLYFAFNLLLNIIEANAVANAVASAGANAGANAENNGGPKGIGGNFDGPGVGLYHNCPGNIRMTKLTSSESGNMLEDPFYDASRASLFYVNVMSSKILRYDLNTGKEYFTQIGNGTVNGVVPYKDSPNELLVLYEDEIGRLTWDGVNSNNSYQPIVVPDPKHPYTNASFYICELKIGPNNAAYFFSRPNVTTLPGQSKLYSDRHGCQDILVRDIDHGRGITWSLDGTKIYFADGFYKVIYKADFNPRTNKVSNIQIFVNYTASGIPGEPDAMTTDSDGYIWMACSTNSHLIIKLDPNSGEVLCSIYTSPTSPTNIAFGRGPNRNHGPLDHMYVTTWIPSPFPGTEDGGLYVIEGAAQGIMPKKADVNFIFGGDRPSTSRCRFEAV